MSDINTLLVVGLPESGKTTFLAALWHVAEREEVPGALCLDRLSDEIRHLNAIKDDWHLCQTAVRSILRTEHFPSLWLKDRASATVGEVVFPDLEGEIFRDQWKNRQWPSDYEDLVQKADRILLFIHPRVIEPVTVAEMQRLVEAALVDENDDASGPGSSPAAADGLQLDDDDDQREGGAAVPWDAELAPTQVQLVDVLQFLEPYIRSKKPVRLAVIISAWDRVAINDTHPTPRDWIRRKLPYLDQYLRSHLELFTVREYGVSAQGGDFNTDTERLRSTVPASNRIMVEGPDCAPHDITEPVRWALGWRV
jgi:hypothetical protein